MALPTVTVEWGESNPRTAIASTTWEDISADFRSATIARGRSAEFDTMRAGVATIVLSNADRDYDPEYAAGPHIAYLKPNRRIRIRATYAAVTYDLFSGFVRRIQQRYSPPNEAVAVIEAIDAFGVLERMGLPASVYEHEVRTDAPLHWWRLGEAAGETRAVDAGSSPIDGTYSGAVTLGVGGLVVNDPDTAATFTEADTAYMRAVGAMPTGTAAFSVEFIVSDATTGGTRPILHGSGSPSFDATISAAGTLTFDFDTDSLSTTGVGDGSPHHILLTRSAAGALVLYKDGVSVDTGTDTTSLVAGDLFVGHPGEGAGNSFGGTLDEVAIYPSVLSAARAAAHYNARATAWAGDTSGARVGRILDVISWPAGDRSIDTGQSTLKSAELGQSALGHIQQVEESEDGLFFVTKAGVVRFRSRHGGFNLTTQGTFGDAGAELGYTHLAYDQADDIIYNVVRRGRQNGVTQEVRDTTSITEHYERTDEVTGLWGQSDAEMLDAANYRLALYKEPQSRIEALRIDPHADEATLFPQVLGRELAEQVVVKRRPQGVGAAIDQTLRIEGMNVTIEPMRWGAEWYLSPAGVGGAADEFLQLDDTDGPGLGGVRLAY